MQILAIFTALIAAATVFVVVRLITRFWFVKSPGVDDCLVVAALLANWVFYAFAVVELYHGLGYTHTSLRETDVEAQLKALWLTIPFYNLSLTLTKLSMTVLYMRIFLPATTTKPLTISLWFLFALITISGLWMFISCFSFCIPIEAFWDFRIDAGQCLPEVIWYLNASIQIATDVIIVVFPMPLLRRLKLPKRERGGVMLVFGLGAFVCAVSAVRLYFLTTMVKSHDLTRTNGPATAWSSIETNVAIICSSLPALHPLLARILPELLPGRIARSWGSKSGEEGEGPEEGIELDSGTDGVETRGLGHRDRFGGDDEGEGGGIEERSVEEDEEDEDGVPAVVRAFTLDSHAQQEEWELGWNERRERMLRRREWEAGS